MSAGRLIHRLIVLKKRCFAVSWKAFSSSSGHCAELGVGVGLGLGLGLGFGLGVGLGVGLGARGRGRGRG